LLSTKAKYVALSKVAQEACWLRSLYSKLGLLQEEVPTLIQGDNEGSIAMAKNPQFHKHSKNIAICWHCVMFHGLFFFFFMLTNPFPSHDCLLDMSPDSFLAYLTTFLSA